MALIHRNLILVLAGALMLPSLVSGGNTKTVRPPSSGLVDGGTIAPSQPMTPAAFSPGEKESYMTQGQLDYIRPGVKIKFLSVSDVAPSKKPVIEISITDSFDQPIDREGKVTPGPVAPAFILARWNADSRTYFSYTTRVRNGVTQPAVDQGGTWTNLEVGHYKYTFGTTLPGDLDVTKTLTLGAYAKRTLLDIVGKDYYADNIFKDFRADGAPIENTWGAMKAATTCNNCHNPLALHGGTRREPKMCALCHTPQNTPDAATGQPYENRIFFHRIHMGKDLPSVKAGTPFIAAGQNYSTIAFPQDIRNCETCHEKGTPDSDIWYTRPSRAACASCHDNVNWVTGANHPGGPQADDVSCATCHVPEGDTEFDASIKGAHTIPAKSKQLAGLKATILSVTNTEPGKNPVVTFKLTNNAGAVVDPTTFGTNLNVVMGGPTTDYSLFPVVREKASGATFDGTKAVYTMTYKVPDGAKGSLGFSMEARRTVKLNPGTPKEQNYNEAAINPVVYAAVTGAVAQPRRTVVALANCNKCHDQLALHGGQRMNTQECVMCHNPNGNDGARRPADNAPVESIDFKRMIHRIHSGEALTQDYTVYGFYTPPAAPNPVNFNEVRFPGDRRDCIKCHSSVATFSLPTGGDLNTTAPRDYFATTPMGPGTTSCLGCHDLRDNAAHAWLMTAPFGESCATCHGTGADWDVTKVHAR